MERDKRQVTEAVERARSGDAGAFEGLYRQHQAGVYSFVRSQIREPELAADLTQQTFVRAWESLARLRRPGAFRGWLYQIAANLVRDEVKSGRARLEVTVSELGDEEQTSAPLDLAAANDGPESAIVSRELREKVWSALGTLPSEQRGAVVMHHLEGMSVEEIARATGVRPGTVMSRLARAREALRERLSAYVEGSDG